MITVAGPWIWAFILLIINSVILHREYKKRAAKDITFTTKLLQVWSILCIITGCITLFTGVTYGLDGFCYFSQHLWIICYGAQQLFMGFYQLSRLYYCFANEQIYSKKGYSKWIFVIMIIIALSVLIYLIYQVIDTLNIICKCGIIFDNDAQKLGFYNEKSMNCHDNEFTVIEHYDHRIAVTNYWSNIYRSPAAVLVIWDITTLLLYYYKIKQFMRFRRAKSYSSGSIHIPAPSNSDNSTISNTKDDKIYHRIIFIMNKIIILTLFYEIWIGVLVICAYVITDFDTRSDMYSLIWIYLFCYTLSTVPLVFSFAMYLMMDHNDEEYMKFLKLINCCKLQYIFCGCCYCCCGMMVDQQLMKLKEKNMEKSLDQHPKTPPTEQTSLSVDATQQEESKLNLPTKIKYEDCELSVTNVSS